MKKVFICARFYPDENHTLEDNIGTAKFACAYALDKSCAPFAPHLLCPKGLDGNYDAEEDIRPYLAAGTSWLPVCEEVWQWGATVVPEMTTDLALAKALGIPIKVFNSIGIPKERWNAEGDQQ